MTKNCLSLFLIWIFPADLEKELHASSLELDKVKKKNEQLDLNLSKFKQRAEFFQTNYQSLVKFKKYLSGYNMDKLAHVLAMDDGERKKLESLTTMRNHCDKQDMYYRQCLREVEISRKTIGNI